ncbi:MAG: hypothetical protein AAGU32_14400 [Bacillota bacterium]
MKKLIREVCNWSATPIKGEHPLFHQVMGGGSAIVEEIVEILLKHNLSLFEIDRILDQVRYVTTSLPLSSK